MPRLDELEDSDPSLGLALQAATVDQLALYRCEEALSHGVVKAVSS